MRVKPEVRELVLEEIHHLVVLIFGPFVQVQASRRYGLAKLGQSELLLHHLEILFSQDLLMHPALLAALETSDDTGDRGNHLEARADDTGNGRKRFQAVADLLPA